MKTTKEDLIGIALFAVVAFISFILGTLQPKSIPSFENPWYWMVIMDFCFYLGAKNAKE